MERGQSDMFALFDTRTPGDKIEPPGQIASLLQESSTTLLINVSGGKDSDSMLRCLVERHRREGWRCRLMAIHADLGAMEWHESLPHCEAVCRELGVELVVVRHAKHDLLEGIEARMEQRPDAPPFPSAAARFCTSGWKRNVIDRWIRHHIGEGEACVSAMGLRAAESRARARKPHWQIRTGAHSERKRRTVLEWNPILAFELADVWASLGYTLDELHAWQRHVAGWRKQGLTGADLTRAITEAGFRAHPAYAMGNERLSCAMCVLACAGDLANGAEVRPDTFQRLVEIERKSGFYFQQNKPLAETVERGRRSPAKAA